MIINWRNREFEFQVKSIKGGTDSPKSRNQNIDAIIMGFDTEQVEYNEIYETQCYQVATDWGQDIYYVPNRSIPLYNILETITSYEPEFMGNPNVMIFAHNLEYDWLQCVKFDERLLEMQRVGFSPNQEMEIHRYHGWRYVMQPGGLFVGTAPHVTIKAIYSNKRQFNIHFRDTSSFFPGTLARAMEDLKLPIKKQERQLDLGKVDYRLVPDSDPDKQYFEEYSIIDAVGTKLIGHEIVKLHENKKMRKLRVSAPSFAINSLLTYVKDEIVNGVEDTQMMQLIFDTYRGGRTGGIFHGRVRNGYVYDFHSSYPASMCSLPSFSKRTKYINVENLELDNVLSIISECPSVFLRVSGYESDTQYPALITTIDKKLTPVTGFFTNIATTGVELYAGYASGSLQIHAVHEMVVVMDMEEDCELPFRQFANTAYLIKEANEKGSVPYTGAKLEMNSSYGKLIESRFKMMLSLSTGDYFMPYLEGMEEQFADEYYQAYLDCIDRGESFDDIYEGLLDQFYEAFPEQAEDAPRKLFSHMSTTGKVFGFYVVPAAASLITAISRARLYAMIKSTGAYYWDTDSAMIFEKTPEQIQQCLQIGSTWLCEGVQPLTIGDGLGELDCELSNCYGYLAGTKRYYLKSDTDLDKKGNPKVKKAVHGLPALPFTEVEKAIESLATGQSFSYRSKERPLKSIEAKNADQIGAFRAADYTSMFQLDTRQTWIKNDDGQFGQIIDYEKLLQLSTR